MTVTAQTRATTHTTQSSAHFNRQHPFQPYTPIATGTTPHPSANPP